MTMTRSVSRLALWFGVLGGVSAWTVHLWAGYALVEVACRTGFPGFSLLGISGVEVLLALVTVAMALVALAATYVAYRARRQLQEGRRGDVGQPRGQGEFMARAGLLMSGLFVAVIVVEAVPALFLRECGWT